MVFPFVVGLAHPADARQQSERKAVRVMANTGAKRTERAGHWREPKASRAASDKTHRKVGWMGRHQPTTESAGSI